MNAVGFSRIQVDEGIIPHAHGMKTVQMMRTLQLVTALAAAFTAGIYVVKFMSGRWVWVDAVGALGFCTVLAINTCSLISAFGKLPRASASDSKRRI